MDRRSELNTSQCAPQSRRSPEPNPKLTKDKLPAKAYFPLAQAAEIAACTADDLLHFGGIGKIRLCIPVPIGAKVFSVLPQARHRRLTKEEYEGYGGFEDSIEPKDGLEMFFIDPRDCRAVEFEGTCSQTHFSSGWVFSAYRMATRVTAKSPRESKSRLTGDATPRRFVTREHEKVCAVRIEKNRMFITALDLDRFVKGDEPEILGDIDDSDVNSREAARPWETDELRILIQASEKFFKFATESDSDSYKRKDDVADWLVNNSEGKISRTLARHADSIIRPGFSKKAGRPRE
jgi:hypothetical protein